MNIPEFFSRRVDASAQQPFLYFADRVISFGEMDASSDKSAKFLEEIGVGRGDKVCLLMSNRPEFIELWLGLAKLGAVMVPLSDNLDANGIAYITNHSDSMVMILDSAFRAPFEAAKPKLTNITKKVWVGPEEEMPQQYVHYGKSLAGLPAHRGASNRIMDSDLMSIIYTSTGGDLPRGTMIPHHSYINTGNTWARSIVRATSLDVFMTTLPMHFVAPQSTTTMGSVSTGCPMVLGEKFVPSSFLAEIRRYGVTVFAYVGWMLKALMNEPPRPDDALNPARLTCGGAAPKSIWSGFEKRFGVTVLEGYGRAESGTFCLVNPLERVKIGSVGKPLDFCDVKIVDESDRELPAGTPGEIVVREKIPNTIFTGYYKSPDLTREVMRKGWFHSGDCGYIDEEENFWFLDRMKDCIRFRGNIIPSFEIEEVINSHPDVLTSAAVGVTSEPGIDDIRVFIVLREDRKVTAEEIVDWCESRMAHFMVPHFVEFIKDLPRTMTQRIRKDKLRALPLDSRSVMKKKVFAKR